MASIEELARVIADVYLKQTVGKSVRWQELTPEERSLWRLVARAAQKPLEELENSPARPSPGYTLGPSKRVLFRRDYKRFYGGHLKVKDYFDHVTATPHFEAKIFVSPDSIRDHLWRSEASLCDTYDPDSADLLFVAGMDWKYLPPAIENRKPVINLVQDLEHSKSASPLFGFLDRRATRICVSQEVADAIRATGRCNGPVHAIPLGIELPATRNGEQSSATDVFIAGLKQPALGATVADRLAADGIHVDLITTHVPRDDFLSRMSRAKVVVGLPRETEGFFMPPLEAMALGAAVVTIDAIGNRSFCIDGQTCLLSDPEAGAIETAARRLLIDTDLRARLRRGAAAAVDQHRLASERKAFQHILNSFRR